MLRLLAVALALLGCVALAAEHGHSHSHDHGHSHGHEHGTRVKKAAPAKKQPDSAQHGHGHSHEHAHAHRSSAPDTRATMDIWLHALGATVAVGLAPVCILFFVPVGRGRPDEAELLRTLLGFAVGGLLGDVFLHLLPHALDPHDHSGHGAHGEHDHFRGIVIGLWVLAGILVFFTIEKWVRSKAGGHAHSHAHAHDAAAKHKKNDGDAAAPPPTKAERKAAKRAQLGGVDVSGWLNLAADFSHNFTDGLAIGASFLSSTRLGIVTTVAVVIHEVPHEIGDFAILIRSGMSRRGAIIAQVATALGCVGGAVVGLVAHQLAQGSAWVLPFTSGGFIYIACTTVLPDLLHECSLAQSVREIGAMVLGVAMMVGIAFIE